METPPAPLAIGALSRRTGCQVETIRYYERAGLLPAPARSPGGYGQDGMRHLRRLTFIRKARGLGFSLDEVHRLLALADERRRPCAEARVFAAAHLADVRTRLAALRAMERVLAETVARCERGAGADCPLIGALSGEATAGHEGDGARPARGGATGRRGKPRARTGGAGEGVPPWRSRGWVHRQSRGARCRRDRAGWAIC